MHVALIPDGNRRWAQERGLSVTAGHKEGAKRIIDFIRWCSEIDEINEVSIFLLSSENIAKRKKEELQGLIKIAQEMIPKIYKDLNSTYDIHLHYKKEILLKREDIKEIVQKTIEKLEKYFKKYSKRDTKKKKLHLLLGYGGRKEIVYAAKRFKDGDEEDFKKYLWVQNDVDILIRTGKETRISNFLLFQIAYAEIFFVDKFWPEITKDDFLKIIEEFKQKERRFGK